MPSTAMPYSLKILWREPRRYLPAVLAVAFSDLLITVQVGLLLGALSVLSLPIDHSDAEVWVASPEVLSIELGYPIPESWRSRLASLPEVAETEPYLYGYSYWRNPHGGSEVCCVIGSRLETGSLGVVSDLTPRMRTLLTEPGAVVVDETELERLGVSGVGGVAEVAGHRVRVVGLVRGLKSLGPPYVFCSLRTAYLLQPLFRDYPGHTMYLLGRCRNPADAPAVARRLRERSDLSAFTREEFSARTQIYWATRTEAGIGMGFTALLSLLVGMAVTSQTLYAATVTSLREYAVLRALGIPRRKMAGLVMAQALWVGLAGIALALPLIYALAAGGDNAGARVILPPWLFALGSGLTLAMALSSGLAALRSLRLVEPITLLMKDDRAMPPEPALAARHLERSYGAGESAARVLRGVSLDLTPGQVLLLMGPSGSGKSTLLAVLSGLLRPDRGEVTILGQDLWRMGESARERFRLKHFGFIFQGFNLFPSLTAAEQLEMVVRWGEGASRREARRRVAAMLDLLGLGRRGHVRADQLSGGEKQRVAVGRALLKRPRFCFADEPTGSLDWGHGEQVIRLLHSAAHDHGAVLFLVGHDPRLIPYADRVLHLVDGQLSAEPAPAPPEPHS